MMEEPAGEAPQNDGEQSTLISAPLKLHLHHLSRLLYNCFSAKFTTWIKTVKNIFVQSFDHIEPASPLANTV